MDPPEEPEGNPHLRKFMEQKAAAEESKQAAIGKV